MIYRAPVRRRGMVFVIVGVIFFAGVFGLGSMFSNASYGAAFTSALLITVVGLAAGTFVLLLCLMPTRIEVDDTEIRLVSPRSTTRYVPAEMAVRRLEHGDFALIRIRTGRTLASFQPEDPVLAEAAFGAAGAQIIP